jgi:hypothetical protein
VIPRWKYAHHSEGSQGRHCQGHVDKSAPAQLSPTGPEIERHADGRALFGRNKGGKRTEVNIAKFGPLTKAFIAACNNGPFIHALTVLTEIEGLLPERGLAGGGEHQTVRGSRVKVNPVYNVPALGADR